MSGILLVSTDREQAVDLKSLLKQDGYTVEWLAKPIQWRDVETELFPEVVLATPETQDLLVQPQKNTPRGFPAPILFVQAAEALARELYLEERFIDRICSPFMAEELLARVDALVRARRVIHRGDVSNNQYTGKKMRRFANKVSATLSRRIPSYLKPITIYQEVASKIAEWADRRDVFELGHAGRVANFCGMIAETLDLDDAETVSLVRAAMLHDIGKVALPIELLQQETPLTEDQLRAIRLHPKKGAALVEALDRDEKVAETILYHHEQPDGEGYYGVKGKEIPQSASILGVAECFDAMTTSTLQAPIPTSEAIARMKELAGTKFNDLAIGALEESMRPVRPMISLSKDPFQGR